MWETKKAFAGRASGEYCDFVFPSDEWDPQSYQILVGQSNEIFFAPREFAKVSRISQ
jgi:hypothetical protein